MNFLKLKTNDIKTSQMNGVVLNGNLFDTEGQA